MILAQSYRNLWRSKKRTMICASSFAVGLGFTVITLGMRESNYRKLMMIATQSGFGQVTLAAADFTPKRAGQSRLTVDERALTALTHIRHNAFMTRRMAGEAIVNVAAANTGAGYLAVDPGNEPATYNRFHEKLIEGEWLSDSLGAHAVIGRRMARKLNVKVGGEIIYTATDAHGEPLSLMATVSGIFATGSEELDGHLLVLPIDRLRRDLGYPPQTVSYIALYAPTLGDVDELFTEATEALTKLGLADHRIYHWHETLPDLYGFVAFDQWLYHILLWFVGLIVASAVFTCMIMNLNERKNEFGIMIAVGMAPWRLCLLLMSEALMLTFAGECFGIVLLSPSFLYLHFIGLDVTSLTGGSYSAGGVTRDSIIIGCDMSVSYFFAIFGVISLMALIAALYPALKAAATIPIQTIRDPS